MIFCLVSASVPIDIQAPWWLLAARRTRSEHLGTLDPRPFHGNRTRLTAARSASQNVAPTRRRVGGSAGDHAAYEVVPGGGDARQVHRLDLHLLLQDRDLQGCEQGSGEEGDVAAYAELAEEV